MRPGPVDGVAERPALGDRERRRLLQVHVLARFDRGDRDERVPVVRRADHDGVHVLVREQLPVVEVARDAVVGLAGLLAVVAVDERLGVFHPPAVEVAHGDDPGRVVLPDARHVVAARDAPVPIAPTLMRLLGARRAEDGRGHDRREARGDDGRGASPARRHAERLAARHLAPACHGHSLEKGRRQQPTPATSPLSRTRSLPSRERSVRMRPREMKPAFTIGVDYGTNSVRALVVDCADGRELGTAVFDYPTRRAGRAARPEGPAPGAAESRRLRARASSASVTGGARRGRDASRASRAHGVIGIGVDTTGSTPHPGRRGRPAAGARPEVEGEPRRARLAVEGPHRGRRGGGDHAHRARARAAVPRADRRHLLVRVVVVEDLALPEGRARRVRRRRELGRARRLRPGACSPASTTRAQIVRCVCAAGHKAMYSRRLGRAARRRSSWRASIRSSPSCATGSTTKRHALDRPAGRLCARVGRRSSACPRASRSRWAASTRTTARSAPGVTAGTLVKIIGTSTCDCAVAARDGRAARHPRHLRHRERLDHAGLLRHRGRPVGGRRHPQVVGRGRAARATRRCTRGSRPRRRGCGPGESGLLALDWNNGNRTILVDPRLTGLLLGQTLHTTRAEIYRALIEATAFGARAIIERLREYGVADRARRLLRRHRGEERRLHADLRRRDRPADADRRLGRRRRPSARRSPRPSRPAKPRAATPASRRRRRSMTRARRAALRPGPGGGARLRRALRDLPRAARQLRRRPRGEGATSRR